MERSGNSDVVWCEYWELSVKYVAACANGRYKIIEYLLDKGLSVNAPTVPYQATPLHMLVEKGTHHTTQDHNTHKCGVSSLVICV